MREIVKDFLHTPSLLLTYLAFAGNTFLTSAYLTWLPSYFVRTHGVAGGPAGLIASAIMFLAIVGAPLGGFAVDAWRKKRPNARPLFAGLSTLLSAAIWLLAFGVFAGTAQYVVMMIAAMCTLLYLSGASAVTQDVVHPGLWAISYAICVIVQNALGSSTGPICRGGDLGQVRTERSDARGSLCIGPCRRAVPRRRRVLSERPGQGGQGRRGDGRIAVYRSRADISVDGYAGW